MNGYIVRSAINPTCIFCTDGQFHAEIFIGPGRFQLKVKVYKTRDGAEKVRNGFKITVEAYSE